MLVYYTPNSSVQTVQKSDRTAVRPTSDLARSLDHAAYTYHLYLLYRVILFGKRVAVNMAGQSRIHPERTMIWSIFTRCNPCYTHGIRIQGRTRSPRNDHLSCTQLAANKICSGCNADLGFCSPGCSVVRGGCIHCVSIPTR